MSKTLVDRLDEKIVTGPGCWQWAASKVHNGYGQVYDGERLQLAHRLVYSLVFGPIPDGLRVDHVCHTLDKSCRGGVTCPHRQCTNPAHLELVTHAENLRRGRNHQTYKTHCPQGHPLSGDNLYENPNQPHRKCRICTQASRVRYQEKNK